MLLIAHYCRQHQGTYLDSASIHVVSAAVTLKKRKINLRVRYVSPALAGENIQIRRYLRWITCT